MKNPRKFFKIFYDSYFSSYVGNNTLKLSCMPFENFVYDADNFFIKGQGDNFDVMVSFDEYIENHLKEFL